MKRFDYEGCWLRMRDRTHHPDYYRIFDNRDSGHTIAKTDSHGWANRLVDLLNQEEWNRVRPKSDP